MKGQPSTKKLIGILQYECEDDAERDAASFLKRYIDGLDDNKMKTFLKFLTGSDCLTVNKLDITFTNTDT